MAVGHLTYLDLTPAQRKVAAQRVREQVRTALANPFLTADQRGTLILQVDRITRWERGQLALGAPFVAVITVPPETKS
jgi:hypothetical protein